jgi:serine/threonine protein kinase
MILGVDMQPIPGYRLCEKIGVGAFGQVWKADKDGVEVALKFLDARAHSSSSLANEIRILRGLAELSHPHIIQFLNVHATSRYLVLEMELGDRNLHDLHQEHFDQTGTDLPRVLALDLLDEAAEALDFLAGVSLPGVHMSSISSRGLQHCDVKPSNLLLVGETLKIADFGLCAGSRRQTHHNGWKGTRPYAAPELHRGQAVSGTDQYALAVTFCELIAGVEPFLPEALSRTAPPCPMPIDLGKMRYHESPVLARALHPQPSARYPSCRSFLEALRKATELDGDGSGVKFPAVRPGQPKRGSGDRPGTVSV